MFCDFTRLLSHTIEVLVDLLLWMPTCLITHRVFNIESVDIPAGSDPLSLFQLRFLRGPQIGEHHPVGYFHARYASLMLVLLSSTAEQVRVDQQTDEAELADLVQSDSSRDSPFPASFVESHGSMMRHSDIHTDMNDVTFICVLPVKLTPQASPMIYHKTPGGVTFAQGHQKRNGILGRCIAVGFPFPSRFINVWLSNGGCCLSGTKEMPTAGGLYLRALSPTFPRESINEF